LCEEKIDKSLKKARIWSKCVLKTRKYIKIWGYVEKKVQKKLKNMQKTGCILKINLFL
jgi:hypothetical protein